MKNTIYLSIILLFELFTASCKQTFSQKADNYPKDSLISGSRGEPRNSSVLYYPYVIKRNDTVKQINFDTMINEWHSYSLFKFKEPVLSNYYLGYDMYRFLWLRSFHRPIIITLSKKENVVTLTTKAFNEYAHYFELKRCMNCDTMGLKDPKMILNETKELSLAEWENFEHLLTKCNFWSMQPYKEDRGYDGAEWDIEAHLQDKYWFVTRWSPRDNFAECGKYLIKLSGLKEEIY